jgi:hypothetical protein
MAQNRIVYLSALLVVIVAIAIVLFVANVPSTSH